jgi:ribosome biogenesis GTPase A
MCGKSSLINKISQKSSLKVGNRPGVTIKKQWIRLGNNIELLDTPGVLWPKFQSDKVALNLAFTGTIKEEILDKEEIAFYLIKFLLEKHLDKLVEKYKLEKEEIKKILNEKKENMAILEVIVKIGKSRGAYKQGGEVDIKKTSNLILTDFREGKIGKITLE